MRVANLSKFSCSFHFSEMAVTTSWLDAAVSAIRGARAILITAGAGLGVDSGLPDFRGPQGFWKAYPPMQALGLAFSDVSNPQSFVKDPQFGWGFFGHRYHLYSAAIPHEGFAILQELVQMMPLGGFVFTSNVDGQFQKAGFSEDKIIECHGSIHHLQCFSGCNKIIWDAKSTLTSLVVDAEFMASKPLPQCQSCAGLARPNILMFGDDGWNSDRTDTQYDRYQSWSDQLPKGTPVVVIEMGAGLSVPTIRHTSEYWLRKQSVKTTLLRINPRESEGPTGTISIPCGSKEALVMIRDALKAAQ
eukprot:TRINITY_DN5946_c0_g1_i1.p1 TRINITY_DN5946_c0_g1~~TRINITY_DN5946_c0_g1_i1.p1  ORF type:complete len:303 (-),score=27.50 TRINITY_DN5946_c0_g1_i1:26-934(-)